MEQPTVTAQPSEDDATMQTGTSDAAPEAQIPQSHDPGPGTISWTQPTGNLPRLPTQPSSSSSTIPRNSPYHATTGDSAYRRYQPLEYNQLALVPGRYYSNVIPHATQGEVSQPQLPGWMAHYQPETSTATLPKRLPVKVRLPREADRSRLAKDILKQLGKPYGSIPPVPTRYSYEGRKKAAAEIMATSVQPPAAPDQVASAGSYPNYPPTTPAGEPPLLEYPDPDPDPTHIHSVDATDQDIHMDIQPPEDSLVPQPPTSPRSNPPQDRVSPPVVPDLAPNAGGTPIAERLLPSTSPLSKRSGPPPDAEIIEISDEEEEAVARAITATVEPMEVDEGVEAGASVSQNLSRLSLDGDDTLVAVEVEKDHAKPLGRRPSQELVVPEDRQPTGRKPLRNQVSVELPPLPEYARQIRDREKALTQEEDEEGCPEHRLGGIGF